MLIVLLVELDQAGFQQWISLACSQNLLSSNSVHSVGEDLGRIGVLTVLVFEDLVCNQIIKVFVYLPSQRGLNEVIELGVQLAFTSDFVLVDLGINPVVFWVFLDISLEVVSVALLFFG